MQQQQQRQRHLRECVKSTHTNSQHIHTCICTNIHTQKVCQGCASRSQSVLSTKLCARLRGKSKRQTEWRWLEFIPYRSHISSRWSTHIHTHTHTLTHTHTQANRAERKQQIVMQCNAKTIARGRTSTTSSTTTQWIDKHRQQTPHALKETGI